MQAMEHTAVMELLDQIPDPEIPVVSIHEMGILRNVQLNGKHCEVTITPTYTACPAMASIADDIEALLKSHGFKSVKVHTVLSPLVHQLDDRRNKTEAENIWHCTSRSPSMQQLVC